MRGKKLYPLLGVLMVCTLFALSAQATVKNQNDAKTRIEELRRTLKNNQNAVLYTEWKMLSHKYPNATKKPSDYFYYYQSSPTALSTDLMGGFSSFGNNYGFSSAINTLTGERAIDERLQIGSIGVERGDPDAALSSTVRRQIESYKIAFKSYPEKLSDLDRKASKGSYYYNYGVWYNSKQHTFAEIQDKFTYSRTQNSYTLKLKDEGKAFRVSDLTPVDIKSHDWTAMTSGKNPVVPEIAKLAPRDTLFIWFDNLGKFTELESMIKDLSGPFEKIYGIKNALDIKEKVTERLGIKDIEELRGLLDSFAFVSDDASFYPNTDYALIFKFKSAFSKNLYEKFVANKNLTREVGGFVVIATDESLLNRIGAAYENAALSLAGAEDFRYTLSVLDARKNGVVYLSEAFIRKLTGPAYRINARRRNSVTQALEPLQYTVFAYRSITGRWPTSLKQIADEGYIAISTIKNPEDYSIGDRGIVSHKIWGSLYNLLPVGRAPIGEITLAEKHTYENFAQEYQSYWREYFDPIGIAIMVGDQISLHTVILPLIEKSKYTWIRDYLGGEPISFSFLESPDRAGALSLVAKLDIESILYAIGKETVLYEEYNEQLRAQGKKDYYSSDNQKDFEAYKNKFSRQEVIKKVKDTVAKELGWDEKDGDVLGYIGNEATFGVGEHSTFELSNIADLDIWFGLKLTNTETAKKFISKAWQYFASDLIDELGDETFGLFSISKKEPLKNTYNDTEYYVIPTGFVNAYYTFINNRLYLTVSQGAMNKLIDGSKNKDGARAESATTRRMLDYINPQHNVLLIADLEKLADWKKDAFGPSNSGYIATSLFVSNASYLNEAATLESTFGGTSGFGEAKNYFKNIPESFFNAPYSFENGAPTITVGGKRYRIEEVETSSRLGGTRNMPIYDDFGDSMTDEASNASPKKTILLSDITKGFDSENVLAALNKLKGAGIGFSLTKEGVDIRIAFTNTVNDTLDNRFSSATGSQRTLIRNILLGAGGIIILAALIFLAVRLKRKPPMPPAMPTPSEHVVPPQI